MSKKAGSANDRVARVFRAFCLGVDTPRSLKAALLVKYGEWEQLARFRVHPLEYDNADSFAVDYAVTSFLKKNGDLPKVADTYQVALSAFKSTELRCSQTNQVFEAYMDGALCLLPAVVQVLHLAQRKVCRLLGPVPSDLYSKYSWGPGAVYEINRKRAYPDTKTVELPFSVTGDALSRAARLISSDLHWKEAVVKHVTDTNYDGPVFRVIAGGRYDTVPKTVLTDRSIMVEPRLNTLLQRCIGNFIAGRLKRVEVDLEDQSRNQGLAAFARDCGLATLDLEAASDSVSRKLVEFLIPPEWFDELDAVRSKRLLIGDSWQTLEKFSSMGNGFTFELESLIFWALSSAVNEIVGRSTLGVYGDDIVVHRDAVPLLVEVLTTCGFLLNKEKSFVEGEFFESCGKHYYGNVEVTPLYQKESPVDVHSGIRMGNRILRFAARLGLYYSLDKRVKGAWECCKREYGIPVDATGPFSREGDDYLAVPFGELRAPSSSAFGPRYRVMQSFVDRRFIPASSNAMYAQWLWSGSVVRDRPDVTITGSLTRVRVRHNREPSDYLPSRSEERRRWRHGWVYPTVLTYLGW